MARNHIGVLQKDTSDRVDNEIDQHVKVPLRDIDANRQWSHQSAPDRRTTWREAGKAAAGGRSEKMRDAIIA